MRAIDWFADAPLQDQVVLRNVIFTRCNDACPLIARKLNKIREALGDKADGISFISLTSDPLRDTPAVLKVYTLKEGIDGPHWFFLTGDKAQMDLGLLTMPVAGR